MHARRLFLPLVLATTAALAACGGADDPAEPAASEPPATSAAEPPPATSAPATTAAATSEPVIDGVPHATGAKDVVLRVTVDGGFVPVEYSLRTMPTYTLYGDGTVIVPGATPEIYPGPAVLPLVVGRLDEAEVQAALVRARDAGLLEEPAPAYGDMGTVQISDAATTTLTVTADGASHAHAAYALDIDTPTDGMPEDVAAARQALRDFIAALPQPASTEPYVPAALRVYFGSYDTVPDLPQPPVVWPLEIPIARVGTAPPDFPFRCAAFEGDDATTLLTALETANELSPWVQSESTSVTFRLVVRPLLPDESGCPTG